MKKQSLITILSLMLTLLMVLGACAPAADPNSGATTPASNDTASSGGQTNNTQNPQEVGFAYDGTAPIFDEPLTISWLCHNPQGAAVANWDTMTWCHEILQRANVNLDIELLDTSVYSDSVQPRLAAGIDLPDVIQLPSKDTDMAYIKSGIFQELTSQYEKYAVNLNKRFETNPTVKAQSTTPDGKIYYIPGINMSVDYVRCLNLNWRWMEQIGAEAPVTTEDFYNLLVSMKGVDFNGNGEADEWPLFLRAGANQYFGSSWGLDLLTGFYPNEEGVVESSFISERYYDYLKYFNRLYSEGLLYNEFSTANFDIQNTLFSKNQVGSTFHSTNNVEAYTRLIDPEWDETKEKLIISGVEPLIGPYGHQTYDGNDPVFGFWGITRDCKNPDEVFAFMDYLYSEEANTILYFGLEGKDHTIENGKMVFSEEFVTNDNLYRARSGDNFGGFPRILLAVHRDTTYVPEIAEINQRLRPYYTLPIGTSFSQESDVDVIGMYATDLSTYWSEMLLSFTVGTEPLNDDTWNRYVQTMKDMGIEELRQVYQNKYDSMK